VKRTYKTKLLIVSKNKEESQTAVKQNSKEMKANAQVCGGNQGGAGWRLAESEVKKVLGGSGGGGGGGGGGCGGGGGGGGIQEGRGLFKAKAANEVDAERNRAGGGGGGEEEEGGGDSRLLTM
jgi:hypothetical protein